MRALPSGGFLRIFRLRRELRFVFYVLRFANVSLRDGILDGERGFAADRMACGCHLYQLGNWRVLL